MKAQSTMFTLTVPWWELVLRSLIVFVVLMILLTPNDLVLLLILSNAVQNSMNAGENSLIGGLISAVTLVSLNYIVIRLTFKSQKIERIIDGLPQILIRDGIVYENVLSDTGITHDELYGALRQNGCNNKDQVHLAILETNGSISVLSRKITNENGGK